MQYNAHMKHLHLDARKHCVSGAVEHCTRSHCEAAQACV